MTQQKPSIASLEDYMD